MKAFLVSAMLLVGGIAQAQVTINGNVYGGGNIGKVTGNASVTANGGTVGKKIPLEDRVNDENGQMKRIDYGNVYGGGNGDRIITTVTNAAGLELPVYNGYAGQVMGNTTVTIGGQAVVRHAVYGGGCMSTVGTCVLDSLSGQANYSSGPGTGLATVVITGDAHIGPPVADLTTATSSELASAGLVFNPTTQTPLTLPEYKNIAFKYLGANEGWVFGSSRGRSGGAIKHNSFVDTTSVTIEGRAQVTGNVFGSGENGHVQKGTFVAIKGNAVVGGFPFHGDDPDNVDSYTIDDGGPYNDITVTLAGSDGELIEDEFGVGRRVYRGNVFGGGKGTDFISWFLEQQGKQKYCYTSGRVYGNTHVEIDGSAKVYNCVYGGGTISMVGTFVEEESSDNDNHTIVGIEDNTGNTYVEIKGGIIGSPGSEGGNCGEVYGGSRGLPGRPRKPQAGGPAGLEPLTPLHQVVDEAYVGHAHVTVSGGTIMSNVYGGAANGHVQGDAHVEITGGTIGTTTSHGWHGNVYGGGGGTMRYKKANGQLHHSITAGRVFGNTYVTITGGRIWHNVYGGGAIASVGTYDTSEDATTPYLSGGHATVTIAGGIIGYDGDENGMVFGSGRGQIDVPLAFMDTVTYVAHSKVNIGTVTMVPDNPLEPEGPSHPVYGGNAKINGSVYGGGENGHVYLSSQVNIYGDTIGCSLAEYNRMSADDKLHKFPYRGNVYGAGCGTDTYTVQIGTDPDTGDPITEERYNPNSGFVQGNTEINIHGGYISHNVYGGGAMASVGFHGKAVPHLSTDNQTALSWPYDVPFIAVPDSLGRPVNTGKTVINITGGHIGTATAYTTSGNVFGGTRGDVGPLYKYDTVAIVKNTEININYTTANTNNLDDDNVIIGTVYGAGENGQTYGNTVVTIGGNTYIGGSVFGGGKGNDTYPVALKNPAYDPETNPTAPVYLPASQECSITAGKVYGNTNVTINNGTVLHNVFGGGFAASVGKGNYIGYGEWTGLASGPEDPYENSGKCTVKIFGGTIGTNGYLDTVNIYNGYVYGSSKGVTYLDVRKTPRYDYSRDFFLGYSNATEVIIGDPDSNPEEDDGPRIFGSVFGGGENGHVRWNSDVTVNKGEIGKAYSTVFGTPNLEADSMVYRGNVYGAGRGVDPIAGTGTGPENPAQYCNSAGSVTLNTTVTVNGGIIHRNVYGGGSMATIGPPTIPGATYNPGTSLCQVNIKGGDIGETVRPTGQDLFNYGGDVFGASRGILDDQVDLAKFCNVSNTQVNIDSLMHGSTAIDEANVIGNVYGGGEIGQVKKEAVVNMKNGTVHGSIFGGGMGAVEEETAALVLGNATVNMTNGAVERSIYGGGELGSVGTFSAYDRVVYDKGDDDPTNNDTVYVPKTCEAHTGVTKVVVSGGNVGVKGSLMPWENHNPNDDDRGWIFCGCQGEADSITYFRAVALGVCDSTYLEIKNTTSGSTTNRPLITASVYGGSENGLVLRNTRVKISGGQIGSGFKSKETINGQLVGHFDPIYDEDMWQAAIDSINNGTINSALTTEGRDLHNYFHECDAWTYATPYLIYDITANETGHPNLDDDEENSDYQSSSDVAGTNGHSFFGNVFGGGSGYYPIETALWRRTAGQVRGNTKVEITGGHILTAVYGGNEYTDVLGKCTVEMSGGTVGVPRTVAQIEARPVNGYVFGAGMGDPRTMFNDMNNVKETEVSVTGGTVFGAVYGGGKEGHVLENATVNIDQDDEDMPTLVGTMGLSGYDGHVFGGGRGKMLMKVADTLNGKRQFPVGRVGGNTHVVMKNGSVLGCLYGGGQIGLVGVDETGWIDLEETYDAVNHGYAKVDIKGGAIGGVIDATAENVAKRSRALLQSDQKVGNVYGGGRGNINEFREDDLGRVAKSVVNISESPTIYGSVFGGGQMANVGYWVSYEVGYAPGTSKTQVNIEGSPTIGTEYEFSKQYANNTVTPPKWTRYDTINGMRMIIHTLTGNVYGGGQGNVKLDNHGYVVGLEHGHCGSSEVNISGNPEIKSCVFGGSEEGAVWGDTEVTISGGTIGKMDIKYDSLKYVYVEEDEHWHWVHDHDSTYSFGSVFGGSYGADSYAYTSNPSTQVKDSINGLAGRVYGDATVTITGGFIRGNVFGGGNMASVGDTILDIHHPIADLVPEPNTGKTTVSVSDGEIGPLDGTGLNAYVFGGGKGFSHDPTEKHKTYANVNSTEVTVDGGKIWGSVFGGGSDSHVLGDAEVIVHSGADIGTNGLSTWDGNIFGGGRNFLSTNHTNGRVAGNVNITMDGGTLQGSIFGGGRLALTGVDVNGGVDAYLTGQTYDDVHHGLVTINVTGGSIGNDDGDELLNGSDESVGDIFGSGKGDTRNYVDTLAGRVANTIVNVSNARIYGSVFGGGEIASIGYWHNNAAGTKTIFYNNTGSSQVTIGSGAEIGTDYEFTKDYHDDSDHEWTVYDEDDGTLIHTCTGNVFGGSQGDVNPKCPKWVSMGRSRTATVTINGGTIKSRVFGGAEQGSVAGNTFVTINGGTIGKKVNEGESDEYLFGGVHGGGYGSHRADYNLAAIENDSTRALRTLYPSDTLWCANYLAGRVYGNTQVDVLGGTIQGDVFGGAAYAYIGGYGTSPNGNATLNIGSPAQATAGNNNVGTDILGSVFGANNHNGTPYGNVVVNVYHTKHTTANTAPTTPVGGWTDQAILDNAATQEYALREVYGGGNEASFTPNETRGSRSTTVHVYYCENTIRDLYGGSNAADVGTSDSHANTKVNVDGGCFDRVFGGGNGFETPSNIHGTATTKINAGVIREVYGGGNSDGVIDNIDLEITHNNADVCDDFIYDVFGGNNEAEVIGDIVSVINCGDGDQYEFYGGNNNATIYGNVTTNVYGGTTDYLFGGSKGSERAAHIRQFPSYQEIRDDQALPANQRKYSARLLEYMGYDPENEDAFNTALVGTGGNVTLNLFGGVIRKAAFGGSDENGTIDGKITVNVYNAGGLCGLDLMDLYGAGRKTTYEPKDATLASPEVNIIHGTVKGNVYGGGMGATATTKANPVVNMGYQSSMATLVAGLNTTLTSDTDLTPPALAAYAPYVNGEIYGGGQLAGVTGNTRVNVFNGTVGTDGIGTGETEGYNGNIYGGGKGSESSLVAGRVSGNAVVEMRNGTVKGNIYGGGRLGLVGVDANGVMQDGIDHGYTKVMVKGGTVGNAAAIETFTKFSMGNVYGGGKGFLEDKTTGTHSAESILLSGLTKNTTVEISDTLTNNTHVYGIVLGGGELASVGKYTLTKDSETHEITNIAVTEGKSTVRIGGGIIGDVYTQMRPEADEEGSLYYNDDLGYVYGGGEGYSADPADYLYVQDTSLIDLIATVQSTEVTITNDTTVDNTVIKPWVKASVFGGSESGHVKGNTKVTIAGGQIGAGDNGSADVLYTDANFDDPSSTTWYATAHWPYEAPYTPFDPAYLSQGRTPKDGRSWFGNVFGGGSGWFPYVTGDAPSIYESHCNPLSGKVWGNTEVIITGGHILNNVYGANESTDVGGKATIRMSGGTVGVPLSDAQIQARPTTSNVFGGGAGDPRRYYNFTTNVDSTDVQITGGTIYGSVFGGGEMGHVMRSTSVSISQANDDEPTIIGTSGSSGYDGHVFGGGKGDETNYDPYPATATTPQTPNFVSGFVSGNVNVTMTKGLVKGNIYGGGRRGSVGMKTDGTMYATNDADHGNIFVNVKGNSVVGVAGRNSRTSGSVVGGGRGFESDTDNTLGKANNTYVNIGESARIYQHVLGGAAYGSVLKDTHVTVKGGEIGEMLVNSDETQSHQGGDVYGGGSGYAPTGLANANAYLPYANIGIVKGDTYVTVKEGAIHGIVYGGGEVASVGTYTTDGEGTTTLAPNTGATHVVVKGGTIGPLDGSGMNGYVFGGSEGVEIDANNYYKYHATVGSTDITIDSVAMVCGSVLGGGADGHVWNSTSITVQGGTIGTDGYSLGDGCVFGGGGNKSMTNFTAGRVGGNIEVAISQPVNERPTLIKGNVYGGGYAGLSGVNEHGAAYTSLDNHGNVTIEISGGTVGNASAIASHFVGNVFGSGKGDLSDRKYGITQSTDVTVSGSAQVLGNVYGGGEVANVERNTTVNIAGGTIGVLDYVYKHGHYTGALDSIVHVNNTGNVFGGGCGNESSAKVAQVKGNANVNISGGHVYFNAYGGGEKAAVGEVKEVFNDDDPPVIIDLTPKSGGYTKVKVTGGQVGPAPRVETGYNIPIGLNGLDGYVYGGGKGIGDDPITPENPYGQHYNLANVNYACVEVNIPADADTITNRIWGSLFGGAEDGHVMGSDTVKLVSGLIGTDGTTSYDGNIFGGGRNFHKKNYTAGRTRGNITVEMSGGQLLGSLFGGGRLALTGIDLQGNIVPDVTGDHPEKFGFVKVKVSGGKVGNDTPVVVDGTTKPFIETFTKYSMGEVFGGGKGDMTGIDGHPAASALLISLVHNTEVEITGDARIYGSVYGGGEVANVGEFRWNQNPTTHDITNIQLTGGGHTKVTISGGTIGADRMRMDYTLVGGSGTDKYNLKYNTDVGHVCGGGKGIVDNPNRLVPGTTDSYYGTANVIYGTASAQDVSLLDVMATVNTTEVIIKDTAFVKGSVFGGAMNGHVLSNTDVKMEGGQIGSGMTAVGVAENVYAESVFVDPAETTVTASVAPTYHWVYGKLYEGETVKRYDPFDPILISQDTIPSDGRTWFGNVYGGGSGYYPYIIRNHNNTADSTVWNMESGRVRGNARVEITGGHVLSNVYGGCETTNVDGSATIILGDASGKPTVGVPRVANDIKALPLPGYVYGSGNGDPRTNFNTCTNVASSHVVMNRGIVYGSVFGGGMDGHVLGDTHVEVENGTIGVFGSTGNDGNVFGGGRGSNPVALTAGGVGGNTRVDIKDGRMFGSIFGGGNNGSVGIQFTAPDASNYGEILDDNSSTNELHGYTEVNISGGSIGHDDATGRTGGNVYGGCRGMAGAPGTIYQRMAKVKTTHVNIWEADGKQTFIRGSVFGSGEDGHVLQDTYVTILGGQIGGEEYDTSGNPEICEDVFHGNVYGGGRGLDRYIVSIANPNTPAADTTWAYSLTAGKVSGNSNVVIKGGRITRNVYGGGNVASVGEYVLEYNEETLQNDTIGIVSGTGTATVRILGGKIGVINNDEHDHGNVFGSSHGVAGHQYKDLAYVHNTVVEVDSVAVVYGSVFGGGDDGHVTHNTTVNVSGGTIGFQGNDIFHGNVYGGGRGLDKDENNEYSPTAGEVYGKATVNIRNNETYSHTPTIWHNVYGGGSASVVYVSKTVNVSGGVIKANVFGGSRDLPVERENKSPRCVNMWGGTVGTLNASGNLVSGTGNVYGCSFQGIDGDPLPSHDKDWAAFINLSGGTVLGSVYGAGYQGKVNGSVGVLIGKNAIVNAPTQVRTADSLKSVPATLVNALDIKGNVYAGSNFFDGTSPNLWREFDVTGYSNIYIDGTGYKTGSTTTGPEMNIRGGLFGSGTNCEAGAAGRNIVLRQYGERVMETNGDSDPTNDSLVAVSRTMTTIQRVSDLVLDGANIALTGARDISNHDGTTNLYGMYIIDTSFMVCNGSSIVLGTDVTPAYIDSVRLVRSVMLNESVYNEFKLKDLDYTWIGVLDPRDDEGYNANLYCNGKTEKLDRKTEENVIRFKGMSQLYVRYHIRKENEYGELQGFFRMSSPFKPHDSESFAYARPKVASGGKEEIVTNGDGGFVSYNLDYNFFTDAGGSYTNAKQYPYTNILVDPVLGECRGWYIPEFNGNKWYVDGSGSKGGSNVYTAASGQGRFPDKPKLTIVGDDDPDDTKYSIMGDTSLDEAGKHFNSETDIIYVVGPISAVTELAGEGSCTFKPNASHSTKPLRIYRYPGGHKMSDAMGGKYDGGPGYVPEAGNDSIVAGPGALYGSLLALDDMGGSTLVLDSVYIDGLYNVTDPGEAGTHGINIHVPTAYHDTYTKAPLVTVNQGTLLMKGNTELTRGYNKNDASGNLADSGPAYYNFFRNPDFDNRVINGGGLYVDNNGKAVVQVEGNVTITDNWQKKGSGTIPCNVYLPDFNKYIEISGALDATARIGVTSPNRNTNADYHDNTLSPVAMGMSEGESNIGTVEDPVMIDNCILDTKNAWINCNFTDDQGWFFASGNKTSDPESPRTTYYDGSGTKNRDKTTLYFGWTWSSVVRAAPEGYSNDNIDSPEDLAWLITSVPSASLQQTADLDMGQYVWVPIGSGSRPFTGDFDGQGHLIKNLYIDYIGTGDMRYERTNYGLFGNIDDGTVDRTFVVSGEYQPYISDLNGTTGKNIGGLVGYMDGTSTVSNSEAAVTIIDFNNDATVTGNAMGGLVGRMVAGEVHSSMAMSTLSIGQYYDGVLGGLVGYAREGTICNSFAKGTFSINNNTGFRAGGLVGVNSAATMKNCYVTWYDAHTALSSSNFGTLSASNTTTNKIQYCYPRKNTTGESFGYTVSGHVDEGTCKPYLPVYSADMLGYMYDDNKVEGDTAMFLRLNDNADRLNGATHKYARWARPGLAYYDEDRVLQTPINGDLPVLLISNYDALDASGKIGAGDFRTIGTYAGGPALQYGGPIRDAERQIDSALVRTKAAVANDYLFVYGDITQEIAVASGKSITQSKISIHEDAAIRDAGALADYDNTYVGVTFDNSFGAATSTQGINYGLNGLGMGGYPLPRDWHMFSSPLQSAPLGFYYHGDNTDTYTSGNYSYDHRFHNPWLMDGNEFSWLQDGDARYWMYGWENSLSQSVSGTNVNMSTWRDGYFPSETTTFGAGVISGSDEDGYFPYGMDLYTWTEPDYHWINFKRNGPNHWHSDNDNEHINYKPYGEVVPVLYPANQNEDNLIVGRGYMASIATETFMQSHGRLNANDVEKILLTKTDGSKLQGWNLVGNPFHSYLDFNEVGSDSGPNKGVLNVHGDEGAFYVVYNADKYENGDANTAFRYYPVNGSVGGDYASRYIHPHQGFYVSAAKRDSLKFTKEMLVDRTTVGDANHLRDEMPAYPLVNLYLSSDQGCADVTVIEFERPEWGGARKIKELRVGDGLFYAHHGDTKYAALFAQTGIDRVPLWFEAKEDDIFTMKWNLANADFHSMYLIDNIAGVQYDMLRNNTYCFEGHKDDYPSRFLIVFSLTDVDEHLEGDGFVFFDGSQWMVTGEGDLEFIDVQGQVLLRTQVNGGQSRVAVPDVAPGVYLFRLTNSSDTRVQKVIVKR